MPLLIFFKEPVSANAGKTTTLSQTVRNSMNSFKQSLRNRELMKYMLATLLYSDCSATLFSVYMVFGSQVGISNHVLVSSLDQPRARNSALNLAAVGFVRVEGGGSKDSERR
eukprot:563789-Rhodomonas_salina.1